MMKAAIYCRVSTADKQDYNRQINILKEQALRHNYNEKNIDVYAESISGYKATKERPELNKLLNTVESNPKYYSIIYTTEISRIGRKPKETRDIIDRLSELKVPVYIQSLGLRTIEEDGRYSMTTSIILQVLIEYAHHEAETFKERSRSGLLASARKGKAGGSNNHPYGYEKSEEGMLVINNEEGKIIKEIFRLYVKGYGAKMIARLLNERKVPTRMNKLHKDKVIQFQRIPKSGSAVKWSDVQVLSIIKNPLYKGERRFKGHIVAAPNIITKDAFQLAQNQASERNRSSTTRYIYLLKDIIKCGKCGRNYFGRYKPIKGGDCVYVCSSKYGMNTSCGNNGVNINFIESVIYSQFKSEKVIQKHFEEMSTLKPILTTQIQDLETLRVLTDKELKAKEGEAARVSQLFIEGILTNVEDVRQRLSKIETETLKIIDTLNSVNRDIFNKKDLLSQAVSIKTKNITFEKMKHDRHLLRNTIQEYTREIIVNSIDDSTILLRVTFGWETVPRDPVFFLLDKTALRSRYGGDLNYYVFAPNKKNKIKYIEGILQTDMSKEVLKIKRDINPRIPEMISITD